jgi:hypothetical protein
VHHFIERATKFFKWVGVVIIILLLLVVAFSQTKWARNIVLSQIEGIVASSTNATLTSSSMSGNLFTGFVLKDVHLRLHTGTAYDSIDLVRADQLLARYSILGYLRSQTIGISSLVLYHPQIALLKYNGDSLWNIDRFIKPTAPSAPNTPFDLKIELQKLQIQNGELIVHDYTDTSHSESLPTEVAGVKLNTLNWSNLDIRNLNLYANGSVRGEKSQSVRIGHLDLRELKSGLVLHDLELSLKMDGKNAKIEEGRILTDQSDLRFAVDLAPASILHGDSLGAMKTSRTALKLKATQLSARDLRMFIPDLRFMRGIFGLDLVADGEFGKLNVSRLNLDFGGRNVLAIKGGIYHLDQPQNFSMDLMLKSTAINDATFRTYLPGLNLPDIKNFGTITIPSLHFVGEPEVFTAIFDVHSDNGNASGEAKLDLRPKLMVYTAKVQTEHLNLAPILNNPTMASDINAALNLEGKGTDPHTMSTRFGFSVTAPSKFQKYAVTALQGTGSLSGSVATTDHLKGSLADGMAVNIEHASIEIGPKSPAYTFQGSVIDLPLHNYVTSLGSSPVKLSADANVTGKGLDLEEISGTISAKLSNMILAKQHFNDVTANIHIAPLGTSGLDSLQLRSDLADIDIQGKYGLVDLIDVVPSRFTTLIDAITNRDFPTDSLQNTVAQVSTASCDSIDFNYALVLKDLRPLSVFFPKVMLLGNGIIDGRVVGCAENALNVGMKGKLSSFLFRKRNIAEDSTLIAPTDSAGHPKLPSGSATRLQLTPVTFSLEFDHLTTDPKTILRNLNAHINFKADSTTRIGSSLLYHSDIGVDYTDRKLRFDVATTMGTGYAIKLVGRAELPQNQYVFALDTLRLSLHDRYRWFNEKPAKITLTQSGEIRVDTLSMIKPQPGDLNGSFAQRIRLGGLLRGDSIVYAFVNVPNLRLNEIPQLLPPTMSSSLFRHLDGKVQMLNAEMKGTLQNPEFTVVTRIGRLKYEGLTLDTCFANVTYTNHTLRGKIGMHVDTIQYGIDNPGTNFSIGNQMSVDIDSIPLLFSFARGPNYAADSARIYKRPLSARLTAHHFPIDIAGPFLPNFDQLTGIGEIQFAMDGTQEHIKLHGDAKVEKGEFRLTANNIFYDFDGALSFADERLNLTGIRLRNIASDDPNGSATIDGYLKFKGFALDTFNLNVNASRLTVLSNASRSVIKVIYGPLAIGTNGPLRFIGPPTAPLLDGSVTILQSSLVIPQSETSDGISSTDGVVYRTISLDDTLITGDTTQASRQLLAARALLVARDGDTSSVDSVLFPRRAQNIYLEENELAMRDSSNEALAQGIIAETNTPSFMDRMRFRLDLAIEGDSWIVITMNRLYGLLGEQLRAQLRSDLPLRIRRESFGPYVINGVLQVTENSSYSFYKNFNATGSLTFRDDATNPELNITAEYVGPHDSPSKQGTEVKVRLLITGTKNEPTLIMQLYDQDAPGGNFVLRPGTQAEVQEDVIYYLISNKFKNELDPAQQSTALAKASQAISSSLTSTLLNNLFGSSSLSSVIRSLSLEYGSTLSASKLKLTAGYRDITFRYGGNALNNPLDADYSIEVPFSTFANFNGARALLFDFDYHTDQSVTTQAIQQPNVLGRFLWRIPIY